MRGTAWRMRDTAAWSRGSCGASGVAASTPGFGQYLLRTPRMHAQRHREAPHSAREVHHYVREAFAWRYRMKRAAGQYLA